jgi:hypothetical protein
MSDKLTKKIKPLIVKSADVALNIIIVMLIIRWGTQGDKSLGWSEYTGLFLLAVICYTIFYYIVGLISDALSS